MEQLDLFEIIEKIEKKNLEENSIKRVEVEITKTYGSKAVVVFRDRGTEEEIKKNISEYFKRVKSKVGVKEYKFLSFENAN